MRVVVQDTLKNQQWVGYEGPAGFLVGRDEGCGVSLPSSRFVSRRHCQVDRSEHGWEVQVLEPATAVTVDGKVLQPGRTATLRPVSQIRLAEFVLTLLQAEQDVISEEEAAFEDVDALQRDLHAEVLRRLELRRAGSEHLEPTEQHLDQINTIIDDLLHQELRERVTGSPLTRSRLLGMVYENRLLGALAREPAAPAEIGRLEVPGRNAALEEAADEFVGRLLRRMDLLDAAGRSTADAEQVSRDLKGFLPEIIEETPDNVRFYLIARLLKKVVCDMIFGLGPLQDLLDTPAVTEIMIVSPQLVYVERGGRVIRSNRTFLGDAALMAVIERIVAPLGRRIDRSQPLVDARLADGSRVNAIIPPLALKGPCLTIRRFPVRRITAGDLVAWGSMTDAAHALLEAAVIGGKNIVVAGGTGSGKTTLLNVLSAFIPESERVVTIEDSAELQLDQEHVVSLETRPPNVEGKGGYTIRDLVRNALRMRPDRIVVGECRGEEAFDMLQAMNTGHDGSMTTIHANSSAETVARIETMCLMAVDIPVAAIRAQIAGAVDLIVFIRRLRDGRRLITQITEVLGVHPLTGDVELRDVMAATGPPDAVRLRPTGYLPTFLGSLVDADLIDLDRWFGRVPA